MQNGLIARVSVVLHRLSSSLVLSTMATTGAWLIHPVLIIAGKIVIDTVPGMTQELSWTLVNLIYLGVRSTLCASIIMLTFSDSSHT